MLFDVLVCVEHHGSRYRSRLSGYVADLALNEPPLLAALREFAIEPLEALPFVF
jgi:hypothetical protein